MVGYAMSDTKKRTVQFGQRIDVELVERVHAVAEAMKSTARAVAELCLEAHLPELERQFGVDPHAGQRKLIDSLDKEVVLEAYRRILALEEGANDKPIEVRSAKGGRRKRN